MHAALRAFSDLFGSFRKLSDCWTFAALAPSAQDPSALYLLWLDRSRSRALFADRLNRAPPVPKKGPNGPHGDPQNVPNSREGFQKAPELEPQALWDPFLFGDGFGGSHFGPPFGDSLGHRFCPFWAQKCSQKLPHGIFSKLIKTIIFPWF